MRGQQSGGSDDRSVGLEAGGSESVKKNQWWKECDAGSDFGSVLVCGWLKG